MIKYLLVAFLALSGAAFAADTKISALPAASALTGSEQLPCVQSGATDKCTAAQLVAMAPLWMDYSTSFFYAIPPQTLSAGVGFANPASQIQCTPGIISQKMTLAALTANVTTVFAGGNFQLAIYASASGRPGALVANTGSGSTASLGFVSPTFAAGSGSSVQVGPGGTNGGTSLWFCVNRDNNTAIFSVINIVPPAASAIAAIIGTATAADLITAANLVIGLSCSGASCNGGSSTFNTWPATLAGSTWTDITTKVLPVVFYTPSSIP